MAAMRSFAALLLASTLCNVQAQGSGNGRSESPGAPAATPGNGAQERSSPRQLSAQERAELRRQIMQFSRRASRAL
jgi:hypothetical protein